jgi:adenylylsulfate kinase
VQKADINNKAWHIDECIRMVTNFISPYREIRGMVRRLMKEGDFIEICCDGGLEVCESRDLKGLYAKGRKGEISEFAGISAPYEATERPEPAVKAATVSVNECLETILGYLQDAGVTDYSLSCCGKKF